MIRALALALLAAQTAEQPPLPPPPGFAPTAPASLSALPGGSRVQVIDYVEDRVITLQGAPGYQVAVEFGGDERIETVSVGDSTAWQVTPNKRGDHLFVKPLNGGVSTNMVVVTDRRLYAFDLVPLSGPLGDLAYAIRFRYPPAEATQPPAGAMAGRYRLHGARALRPGAVSDDGVHTYLQWPNGVTLPAIYVLDGDGHETLAGGAMRDDTYVIDGVAARLVFRRDRQAAYADRLPPGRR